MKIAFCLLYLNPVSQKCRLASFHFFCGLLFRTCPKSMKLVTGNEFAPAVKPESVWLKRCWTQWPGRWGVMSNNLRSSGPLSLSTLTTCCFLRAYEGGSALDVIACLPRGAACWDTPSLPLISQPILLSWGDSPVSVTMCVRVMCVGGMSKVNHQ